MLKATQDAIREMKRNHAHRWMIADDDGTEKEFASKAALIDWLELHDCTAREAISCKGVTYYPGENTIWRIWRLY